MNKQPTRKSINRRDFFKLAGGAVIVVAGASVMPQFLRKTLLPEQVVGAAGDYDLFFAGTDGWMHLPPTPGIPPFFPDDLAPAPFNTYIFGFRNLTTFVDTPGFPLQDKIINQKMKAQHNAPFF